MKIGKTGDFPQGKLNKTDEGGFSMAVSSQDGKVLVLFGTPVAWLGLDKKTAINLARSIMDHAMRLPGEEGSA